MQGIDLKEWELVISNGAWLIGRVKSDDGDRGVLYSPILELHHSLLPMPQDGGGVVNLVPLKVTPFLGLGLPELRVPKGAIREPLEIFNEANGWISQIEMAITQQNNLRAARLGVVIAH